MTVRRLILIGALLASLSACSLSGAPGSPNLALLPPLVPPVPFVKLVAAARGMGDAAPTAAVWVASRHRAAVTATMGDTVDGNQPVYVAVLTGHFTDKSATGPPGAKPPTGTVATFVYDVKTGRDTDFGLSDRQPSLSMLGTVHNLLPYLKQASVGTAGGAKGAPTNIPASIETQWLQRLSAGSRLGCRTHFHNLRLRVFRRRLYRAASRDGFQVESVQFLHACQSAPVVYLRTAHPQQLSGALPILEKRLDRVTTNGHASWAFEGLLIEASDASGKPIIAIWNHLRAEVVGGQWATSPDLYPFPHG